MSDMLLEGKTEGERLKLAGAGAWIAENAHRLESEIDGETKRSGKLKRVDIDMAGVERLDTFGAWLLERLIRAFSARGCDTKVTGLREDYRALMEELHAVKPEAAPVHHTGGQNITYALASIGHSIVSIAQSLASIVNMLGALSVTALRVAARPGSFRFTSLVHQLDNVGLARGADHPADHLPDRLHHRATGPVPFPQIRRRRLCRGHGRHIGAARTRRADRLHHGGGPFRHRLHRRTRLHENARGDRRARRPWASIRSRY